MKKYIYGLLLLGLCCFCGCKEAGTGQTPVLLEPAAVKMDTASVQYGDMYKVLTYSAEVVPYVEEVVFQTDGILGSMDVVPGEQVVQGQILARLDARVLEEAITELEEAIADLNRKGDFEDRKAHIEIEIAKAEMEILKVGVDSPETFHAREIAIGRMEQDLEQTQQLRQLELEKWTVLLEEQKKKLAQNQITAPFDGTVVYVNQINTGDAVNSYVPMVCVADESRLRVQADYISKTNIAGAERLTALIGDAEYQLGYLEIDESEYISRKLSGSSVKSDFEILQTDEKVSAGDYAVIRLYYSCRDNVLTIPANALYLDGTGQYVYVVEEEQRIRRSVKVGLRNEVEAEILEGLQEGELVYVKE